MDNSTNQTPHYLTPDTSLGMHDTQGKQQQQEYMSSSLNDSRRAASVKLDRKIAVLGLPWSTDEASLTTYFSQFGRIEGVQIMRDRYNRKSRGFGFISFSNREDALKAMSTDHIIDGRHCEAKFALPERNLGSSRTTRIFIARIPSAVTDIEFKSYFEQYGEVLDAYMPKDTRGRQGHRGIGFVTFASSESVEIVMSKSHVLCGNEIAIDRATPKERVFPSMHGQMPSALLPHRLGLSQSDPHMLSKALTMYTPSSSSFINTTDMGGRSSSTNRGEFHDYSSSGNHATSILMQRHLQAMAAATPTTINAIHPLGPIFQQQQRHHAPQSSSNNPIGLHTTIGLSTSSSTSPSPIIRQHGQVQEHGQNTLVPRSGYRMFVGKLNRETTDVDVRDYFSQFGNVLDVYLPRDKVYKWQHRGFGFLTFETDASVQQVLSAQGPHVIRGSVIAVDAAALRREEGPNFQEGATLPFSRDDIHVGMERMALSAGYQTHRGQGDIADE